jgi:hypothetical protein
VNQQTHTAPAPASSQGAPGDDLGQDANFGQVWGIRGAVAGVAFAAVYLLGQDKGWPLERFLAGGAAGGIGGGLVGLVLSFSRGRRAFLLRRFGGRRL